MTPTSERHLGPVMGRGTRYKLNNARWKLRGRPYGPEVKTRIAELIALGANQKQILARTPFEKQDALKSFCDRHGLHYPFNHNRKAWTDDEIDLVRRLLLKGKTVAAIAKRLGVTKNSVVGKIWRFGLRGMKRRPKGGYRVVRKKA